MFQRLPIALAHAKAGNTSENLLNKKRQIIYSLHPIKKSLKKCSSIKGIGMLINNTEINAIFVNSKNSKISHPCILLLNLTDKIDLRKEKYIAFSNLSIYYT